MKYSYTENMMALVVALFLFLTPAFSLQASPDSYIRKRIELKKKKATTKQPSKNLTEPDSITAEYFGARSIKRARELNLPRRGERAPNLPEDTQFSDYRTMTAKEKKAIKNPNYTEGMAKADSKLPESEPKSTEQPKTSEPVIPIDGSNIPRALTFPGAKKTPTQKQK